MLGKSFSNIFMAHLSIAVELIIPNGIFKNSYDPSGLTKTVFRISSSGMVIFQYPLLRSILEKYLSPFNFWIRSSVCSWHWVRLKYNQFVQFSVI